MDLPGVMITLVVAGTVGFIGLEVMSTVIDTTTLSSDDPLYNALYPVSDYDFVDLEVIGALYELISPGIRRSPRRSEFLDLRKLALDPVSGALGFRRFGRRTELL